MRTAFGAIGLLVLIAGFARGDDDVTVSITGKVYLRADKTGSGDNDFEVVVGDKRVYPLIVSSLELRRQLVGHMLNAARRDHKAWDNSRVKVSGGLDESGAVLVQSLSIDGAPAVVSAKVQGSKGNQLAGKLVLDDDSLAVEAGGKTTRLALGKSKADLDYELNLRGKVGQQVTLTGTYRTVSGEEVFAVPVPKQ